MFVCSREVPGSIPDNKLMMLFPDSALFDEDTLLQELQEIEPKETKKT